jgi:hypothetical protein
MVRTRVVAGICAAIVLGGALLVPNVFAAHEESINLSASPAGGELYFVGDKVPDTFPSSTARDERQGSSGTCQDVADWAKSFGAVPINNDEDVRVHGPAGTDINVLEVAARIETQRPAAGPIRVRCPEIVHDQVEPDYQVDFAQSGAVAATRPPRPVSLRATSTLCALPLATCGEASLRVAVSGVERTEYRYYLQITYLVGHEKRTSIIGDTTPADSRMWPLRTVVERDRTGDREFAWAPQRQAWESVPGN